MDSNPLDTAPELAEQQPPADEAPESATVRAARLRVAILAGMTVGAVAAATLGGGPTTVASVIHA